MKGRPIDEDNLLANRIRDIVWESPGVETSAGHIIRGLVGLTDKGDYRVAYATLPNISEKKDTKYYGKEIVDWDYGSHERKGGAIGEARKGVDEIAEMYSRGEHKSAATKYGGNDTPGREIAPPSRSR